MRAARPAGPRDLPALVALEARAFPGEAWSEAQVRDLLARPDVVALVVEDGQAVVAAALGWAAGGVSELLRIAVDPASRRRGQGGRLLSAFAAACHAAGAEELWLEVRPDNHAALALYRARGLSMTGRRPRYYADGADALLLGCPLPLAGLSA
ncbi:ribosomal protein S18-alanine N-acetyltransferase [Myxococcota bacterium]|nr:ribosomal protein S18-alanine N-acetyltransferase [Myxococcota bacterium]